LFVQLCRGLKAEADVIASQAPLSTRQKLDRYLEHVKRFDAAWLVRLAPRSKSTPRAIARDRIYAGISQILAVITHTASFSLVVVPPGVVPLGLTADGNIAPPEYPDRPSEMKRARHLVEFPPAAWEDQRAEALRWGDRDSARWGDEPPAVADPRPMAERLAEWEGQVAECARQDAPRRKAAEEIYRPHGLFERALPPDVPLDRISFRSEAQYIEITLRHDLVSCAERLLLDDTPVVSEGETGPKSPDAPRRSRGGERKAPMKRGRPLNQKRPAAQIRRSRDVHAECDPALEFLGWSAHDWADRTMGKVKHSAIDRILSGETIHMRRSTRWNLLKVMEEELTKHGRKDLLMTSPRWTGDTPHSAFVPFPEKL
jgi:hypothetical protein